MGSTRWATSFWAQLVLRYAFHTLTQRLEHLAIGFFREKV